MKIGTVLILAAIAIVSVDACTKSDTDKRAFIEQATEAGVPAQVASAEYDAQQVRNEQAMQRREQGSFVVGDLTTHN